MAMGRAVASLFVLLLLVQTAPAARTVADTVQELCSKTQFPKICIGRLTPLVESQKASPRRLAELFVNIASEAGSGMAAFVNSKLTSAKDDAVFKCYDSCSDEVEEAVGHLNGLVREPTDGKFLELKSWLSSTLGGTSACEEECKDAPPSSDKDEVVKYSVDIEKLLRITLDLITECSGSMSADIALPPSDASAPAYGAAAPFAGYGSSPSSSAEAPGPDAESVFPEGDGKSSPAYGAASSDASAPSAGSSSEAPEQSAESPEALEQSSAESSEAPEQSFDESSEAPAPSETADAPESDYASDASAPESA